jgi:hypothetical protein
MAVDSGLLTGKSSTAKQTRQYEDWVDEEESANLSSGSEDEEDEITDVDPSPNASESDPPRTRGDVSNQNRAQVHKASNDHTITDNYALDIADAAVRQAMWMLRDAHNVRDNIIRHRIAFLQRREEARKDFDLLNASVMESFAKYSHDRTGGRTVARWELTRDHYKDMASKVLNVHERRYWRNMVAIAVAFIIGGPRAARRLLMVAAKLRFGNHTPVKGSENSTTSLHEIPPLSALLPTL